MRLLARKLLPIDPHLSLGAPPGGHEDGACAAYPRDADEAPPIEFIGVHDMARVSEIAAATDRLARPRPKGEWRGHPHRQFFREGRAPARLS
jgi:hypothetical protein